MMVSYSPKSNQMSFYVSVKAQLKYLDGSCCPERRKYPQCASGKEDVLIIYYVLKPKNKTVV